MNWLDIIRAAGGSLAQRKLRSALTALGISIGVAAVVATVSIGHNISQYVEADIARLMSNGIVVTPEPLAASGLRVRLPGRLTDDDGAALAAQVPTLAEVAGTLSTTATVVAGARNATVRLQGVDSSYFRVRNFRLAQGRLWSASDPPLDDRVCILGAATREKLFAQDIALDREVRVGAFSYRVIGVAQRQGASMVVGDQDDRIFLPLGTFRRRVAGASSRVLDNLLLSADSADTLAHSASQIDALLRQRHGIAADDAPDFRIRLQEEFLKKQQAVTGALATLLLTVATISLLVAGIGVMNIMLVTVVERTREIGIVVALGADAATIRAQFLVESLLLCVLGGTPGAVVGVLVTVLVGRVGHFSVAPSSGALLAALLASGCVGLLSGLLPARRAARLNPITALSNES